MILSVVQLGEDILFQKSQPVKKKDAIKKLISDMIDTVYDQRGIGLAAVQVGIPKRLFVVDIPEISDGPRVFINPEIKKLSLDLIEHEEGCLSIAEIRGKVKRPRTIELEYCDQDFVIHREIFSDLFAICIQHEIDHLDGILFLDRLEKSEIRKTKKLIKAMDLPEDVFHAIDFGGKSFSLNHLSHVSSP